MGRLGSAWLCLQLPCEQKADLLAGKTPSEDTGTLTIHKLCAAFLTTKKGLRDAGELSLHTFEDYAKTCQLLQKSFGKGRLVSDLKPADFERLKGKMAKRWGPVRIGNTVNKCRIVFNYAYKNGLLSKPMVYGEGFKRPSKKVLRQHRQARGPKLFEAAEVRAMLKKAGLPLRAMLLLGVQAGFGNADVGKLPLAALSDGWINYPRVKTAIERHIPLWPETVAALKEWLKVRPKPAKAEFAELLFLTAKGGSWAKETSDNPVSKETAKLMIACGLNGHRNFYCCRHTFQTIGDESGDFLAVRRIMGHASNDIADEYRERISDERLRKVTDHVRVWLFAKGRKAK